MRRDERGPPYGRYPERRWDGLYSKRGVSERLGIADRTVVLWRKLGLLEVAAGGSWRGQPLWYRIDEATLARIEEYRAKEKRDLSALWLLAAFIAVALGAELLSSLEPAPAPSPSQGILTQLIPCAGFVALSAATGNQNFLIGSLASLSIVGRRLWGAIGPVDPGAGLAHAEGSAKRCRNMAMALESLSGMGSAWVALLMAGLATILFDLGRVEASALAIVLASAAGGLVSCLLQRSLGGLEPRGEPLIQQFIPALLALSVVPIVSILLLRLSG